NPFYDNSRAGEIIRRTRNFSNDLQFYHLTENVRDTIDSVDFSWNGSTIRFRPFNAVPSRFPLLNSGQRDVYIVFLSNMFNYIVIPSAFEEFLQAYKQGVQTPVSFEKLSRAFEAGMEAYASQSKGLKSEDLARRMLERMAREGFVLYVKATQTVLEKQDKKPSYSGLHENFPRASGRYPSTERPFEFGTFPFAMVLSTLMV
ncbi:MAG TPA: hypothetical protein VN580_00235, partial [Clostridia bacterium]|nr:hypothetical protein [Clostridia bacterium]